MNTHIKIQVIRTMNTQNTKKKKTHKHKTQHIPINQNIGNTRNTYITQKRTYICRVSFFVLTK